MLNQFTKYLIMAISDFNGIYNQLRVHTSVLSWADAQNGTYLLVLGTLGIILIASTDIEHN